MASKFAILLIGGTGKVCSRIAPILSEAGIPTLLASRSGTAPDIPGVEGVHFNWEDETTYNNPFLKNPNISAIFLVAPRIMNSAPIMKNFIDFAREKNVKRFVLLSASVIPEGGPVMGQVHAYLKSLPVGWAVLQPSWFMENLSEEQHLEPIRDRNEMYSATGAGKIPWVACDDIAAVGFRALADEVPHKAAHLLANILTEILGRKITHIDLTEDELVSGFKKKDMPEDYARLLARADRSIKAGEEERLDDAVRRVTGKDPRRFKDFAGSVKGVWMPKN